MSVIVGCVAIGAAQADMPVVIFSDLAGHPTAQVPGTTGVNFYQFGRPFRSPDGSRWAMTAFAETGSLANDELLVVGAGPTSAGARVIIREGDQAPWAPAGHEVGNLDTRVAINDAGVVAFGTTMVGTTPVDQDEQLLRWSPSTRGFDVVAREGDPLPNIPDNYYGNSLDSASILQDGTVGFTARFTVGTLFTDEDDFVFLGDSVIIQESDQIGSTDDIWHSMVRDGTYFSADGAHHLIGGKTHVPGLDNIVYVDGEIVVREDGVIPGFNSPVDFAEPRESRMESNGDFFVRGQNDDSQDWVMRNGEIVAATGDEVPGSNGTEFMVNTFANQTFFGFAGNNRGDYVYVATTDDPDSLRNDVVIWNNERVVLREGDPVDLNGNGMFDDGVFIRSFIAADDDHFLTDSNELYFRAFLMNGSGGLVGEAFMVFQIPRLGDINGDGVVNGGDLNILLSNWDCPVPADDCQGADLNADGNVDGSDLNVLLSVFDVE